MHGGAELREMSQLRKLPTHTLRVTPALRASPATSSVDDVLARMREACAKEAWDLPQETPPKTVEAPGEVSRTGVG